MEEYENVLEKKKKRKKSFQEPQADQRLFKEQFALKILNQTSV